MPTKMFKCNLGACMQNTMAVQSAPATRVQHDAEEGGVHLLFAWKQAQ